MADKFRVAFLSGKLGDVDGVSLEVDKWISVIQGFGHEVFTIGGAYRNEVSAVPRENQHLVEQIRFGSEKQQLYEKHFFPHMTRFPPKNNEQFRKELMEEMIATGEEIADILHELVKNDDIDVIIGENTNAMPMTLLGGIGLHRLATDKRVATIFHHHDFWWERSRFSHNYIERLLNRIMPPVDLGLEHVVISSYASHILTSLKRVRPQIVPNCEDFDHTVGVDEYNSDFRRELGFNDDDVLIVQPTRVVPRKRIEDSVALVRRLVEKYPDYRDRVRYVISLYQGDEPNENYIDDIRTRAAEGGVSIHFISDRVASVRGLGEGGRKMYTNRDVLAHADLVTYLPIWEGFGNALLEAIAARVPVVTTTYLVYKTDIKITGVQNIEIRDRYDENGLLVIPDEVLESIRFILTHPTERRELVETNFQILRSEFGMDTLRERLGTVFAEYGDEIRASRIRIKKSKAHYPV